MGPPSERQVVGCRYTQAWAVALDGASAAYAPTGAPAMTTRLEPGISGQNASLARRSLGALLLWGIPALTGCNQMLGLEDPVLLQGGAGAREESGVAGDGAAGAAASGANGTSAAGSAGTPASNGDTPGSNGGTQGEAAGTEASAGADAAGAMSSGSAGLAAAGGEAAGFAGDSGAVAAGAGIGGRSTVAEAAGQPSSFPSGGEGGTGGTEVAGGAGGNGDIEVAGGADPPGGGTIVCGAGQYTCDSLSNALKLCNAEGTGLAQSIPCNGGICDATNGQCDRCVASDVVGCSDDNTSLEVCDEDGQNIDVVPCIDESRGTPVCVGAGICAECQPSSTRCDSLGQITPCGATGQWQSPEACVDTTCVETQEGNASCQGDCGPGQTTCLDGDAYDCDGVGQWSLVAECASDEVCFGGTCVECLTGTKDCIQGVPRECIDSVWQSLGSCSSGVCAVGDCIDAEMAQWPMPNEPTNAVNPASYEVLAGGEVVGDLVTGLQWQAGVSPTPIEFNVAKTYCRELYLGGHRDFRLPTAIELYSLVDYSVTAPPMIDSGVFPNTPLTGLADSSFVVDFERGDIQYEYGAGLAYTLRCVRSTTGAVAVERYTVGVDSVVDSFTGLVWAAAATNMTYGQTFLNVGCAYPKRVPTVKELMTLIDRSVADPPITDTTAFPNARDNAYWSNTGPGKVVSFTDGSVLNLSLTTDAAGRCLME